MANHENIANLRHIFVFQSGKGHSHIYYVTVLAFLDPLNQKINLSFRLTGGFG